MASYRKPAFAGLPDDATKEDLEDVIADLVEQNAVAPEVVRAVFEERRRLKKRSYWPDNTTKKLIMKLSPKSNSSIRS